MSQPPQPGSRSSSGIKLAFRPDIEGLRALAILLVIFSHAGLPVFPSGFIGVDVFFVLSGYLITRLLLEEIRTTGRIRFSRFYARRARRLLPAALLLVVAVCLVEAVVINPLEQYRVLKAAFATLLYSSNIYFAHVSESYFNLLSAANPLLHTWSLAVEEQFYLVWPILLLLLTRGRRSARALLSALVALAALSFAFCIWCTSHNLMSAFFNSPARAWEFCLGALLALVPDAYLHRNQQSYSWLGACGFAGLLLCAQWIPSSEFPGFVAIFPALGAMAILLAGAAAPSSLVPRLLSTQPAQIIGRLSYSLYLWHWPALVIGQQLFPSGSLAVRLAAIAVAAALAALTYWLVENPIRFHPFLLPRPGLTLKLALIAACISIGALGTWRISLLHSAQYQKFNQVLHDIPTLYLRGCSSELTDPRPRLCSFGETQSPRSTVVLFGDSHAAEWFPALEEIAQEQHWKLISLVKPGCTPLKLEEESWPVMGRVCAEWWRSSIAQIHALHPDMVIVSCSTIHTEANGTLLTDPARWQQAARATFVALSQPGTQIRFLRNTPQP
ncbi:MAG: acyltransferase family protein, partial [Terracidiphilus sp.]